MAISMDDIKCRKSKQYPGDPYHVITVAGTPVENIQKHTRRGRTWYESDTFSTSYNTITEAKEKTFERCKAGYYGPALSADTTGEKEPESMIIEPGSELDKRAEANETAIDAMSENDVRALAQALGHRITDRNGNARDTQVLRDALKQTHPDDFDAALASIQPATPVAAAFEALHDAKPEPFNAAYDPDHHAKAAVISAMVEAGEPYLSREARAEAHAKAYASLDGKRLAFESIVFAQGDDAREPLHLLNHEGEQAALDYLLQWDMGDGGELADVAPWGESDRLWGKGDLLVSYNNPLGYIGLCRVIIRD